MLVDGTVFFLPHCEMHTLDVALLRATPEWALSPSP
jgi:hypothetical protein